MRPPRISITGLMTVVLFAAVGLAALLRASQAWAGVAFLATCGVLALAIVGVACREGPARAWWLGFALFGGGHLALGLSSSCDWHGLLPTLTLLGLFERSSLGASLPHPYTGGFRDCIHATPFFSTGIDCSLLIGHCLLSLLAAACGGVLAGRLLTAPGGRPEGPAGTPRPGPRGRLRPVAALGAAGLVLAAALARVGSRPGPEQWLWAAAALALTWGLLGLAALGAALGGGRRRATWLGVALFGVGYMTLVFSRLMPQRFCVDLGADRLVGVLRSSLPSRRRGWLAPPAGLASANARILEVLDRPVPMRFRDETTLEEFVGYIRAATRGPDGRDLPIHVDPVGLNLAEKTMNSALTIDLDGPPLRTTLRLALKQLELTYVVQDGVLLVTAEDYDRMVPSYREDPFMLIGHCLLATLAAGLGGLVAPLVSVPAREPTGRGAVG